MEGGTKRIGWMEYGGSIGWNMSIGYRIWDGMGEVV